MTLSRGEGETIRINVFKDTREPFAALLTSHGVEFERGYALIGVPMAAGEWFTVAAAAGAFGGLAHVVVTYLKAKHGRKVIITTRERTVVHAEGLTHEELEKVLSLASNITVIDTKTERSSDATS
jgi:hypothetical protein